MRLLPCSPMVLVGSWGVLVETEGEDAVFHLEPGREDWRRLTPLEIVAFASNDEFVRLCEAGA